MKYGKSAKRRMEHGTEGRKYGVWGKDFLRDTDGYRESPTDQKYDTLLFVSDTTFAAILDIELPEGDQDSLAGHLFVAGTILQGYFTGIALDTGTGSAVICYRSKE